MIQNNFKFVILAAGKGTRMKSELPKALAPLRGKPMVKHVLEAVEGISTTKPIVVVGHQAELVKKELGGVCEYALQSEQLGTGHALASAEQAAASAAVVVVLSGDQPLIKKTTIKRSLEQHFASGAKITLAITSVEDFTGWKKYFETHGRIIRNKGEITGIREYKNASAEERRVREVNTGCVYIFEAPWVWQNLKKLSRQNAQGEYLLTDLIELAVTQKEKVGLVTISPEEALGANSQEELETLEKLVS